jgi:hypothetical protein
LLAVKDGTCESECSAETVCGLFAPSVAWTFWTAEVAVVWLTANAVESTAATSATTRMRVEFLFIAETTITPFINYSYYLVSKVY